MRNLEAFPEDSNALLQQFRQKRLTGIHWLTSNDTMIKAFFFFQGVQIPAGVPRQMELCAQLPALNVKENIYSLFHVACPVLQRNCKHISSSFGRVGWGKGEGGGGIHKNKKRLETFDFNQGYWSPIQGFGKQPDRGAPTWSLWKQHRVGRLVSRQYICLRWY